MAKFTSVKRINSRWRNQDFLGNENSSFSIPDEMYDEFISDWSYEIGRGDIVITETPTTGNIQVATLTVGDIVLTGTATGSFGAGASTTVVGTSPIAVSTSSNTATVSLSASYSTSTHLHTGIYQPTGTYVTSVSGSTPISATGTTSATISITSGTAPNAYVLGSDGAGGVGWIAQTGGTGGGGLSTIVGTSPITASIVGSSATVGIDQSLVTAENAGRTRTLVRNTTASTITKGSVVYIDGSSGTVPTIQNALADADATSARTFGIVEANIGSNANGYVTNQGLLTGLDTSATGIIDGAVLWLSASVAGSYTTTKPSGPNHGVLVGIVVKGGSAGAGSIYVLVKNGAELDEIHDVNISGLANGDTLIYSSSASVWQNKTLATAGIAASTHTHGQSDVTNLTTALAAKAPLASPTFTGDVTLNAQGDIRFADSDSSNWVALQAPATIAANVAWTLPGADATSSGQVLSSNAAGILSWVTASGSATVSVSEFTASGTWTKPAGVTAVYVLALGGGGGGGGGATTYGGGGGGGAVGVSRIFPASILGSTASVTIGAAGTGGAATVNGVSGGATIFNVSGTTDANLRALGGGEGPGAATTQVSRTPHSFFKWSGALGTPTTPTNTPSANQVDCCGGESSTSAGTQTPVATGAALLGAGGGGAGSGTTTGNGNYGRGGFGSAYFTGWPSGGTGTTGGAGGAATQNFCGGAGGGGNSAGTAGAGGAGKLGGGGGGGGRGSVAGGAGAAGGDGYCLVISW